MGGEYMEDADIARLEEIAKRTYGVNGERVPQLTENELENLCIRKGTLTEAERLVINNHATVSIKMLSQLPFSKGLSHVPEYAGGHHEKLNGEGYPQGLTADELPLQSRILAVADVFEALTAPDRPYRPPMKLSQALKILASWSKTVSWTPAWSTFSQRAAWSHPTHKMSSEKIRSISDQSRRLGY